MRGRPHHQPMPRKTATSTGASAVPRPSSALRYSTARSTAERKKAPTRLLSDGTVSPKPIPRLVVASSRTRYGSGPAPMVNWLTTSSAIAATSPTSPARRIRFTPACRVSRAPNSDAAIAASAWGRNSDP